MLHLAVPEKYAELNSLMLRERAQKVCVDANVAPVTSIIWRQLREGMKESVKNLAQSLRGFLEQDRQLADDALLSQFKGLRQRVFQLRQKVVSEGAENGNRLALLLSPTTYHVKSPKVKRPRA